MPTSTGFTLRASALALAAGLVSARVSAQDAGAVVDAVVQAYGGSRAVDAVDALRLEGGIVTHPGEAQGSFIRIGEGPDRLKVLLHYPDRVEIRIVDEDEGLNGSSPETLGRASGPMLDAMHLQAARSWVPWILQDMRDRLVVERDDAGVVVLAGDVAPGLRLRFFVRTESHHVTRTESEMAMGPMSMVFATDYGDFRSVSGVLVAFSEESWASGTHTASLSVSHAVLNPPPDQRLLPTGR